MQNLGNTGQLLRVMDFFKRLTGRDSQPDPVANELPLRDELFSAEQMEQHGKALALKHTLGNSPYLDQWLSRLGDNERCLNEAHSLLTEAVKSKLPIVPAGEWLLDNFYLIDEQFRIARRHLPKNYSRELPRLGAGPSCGLPRVYDLALEVISHSDSRVDSEALTPFIAAYQTVTPLLLGELWAVPIMLRLALIENLRRVSVRITVARVNVNLAQAWANKMLEVAESDRKSLILIIADMARSRPPMVSSFVAELERCLRGHGSALALPLTWIRQRLAESSLTIEQLVLSENQQQAADQVSVSNTIGSLRFLGAIDWRDFVESMSLVEQALRGQSATYSAMDFSSRDRYRQVVDVLAKHSPGFETGLGQTEIDVAQMAFDLAQSATRKNGLEDHTAHVGYYLIDEGRPLLEAALGVRLSGVERISRWLRRGPLAVYLGAILLLTVMFSSVLLIPVYREGVTDWQFILLAGLVVLAFSQLASALVNWLVTLLVTPQLLPRMDYSRGLPPETRTLVVIPTLLDSVQGVADLLEALEVRFLGCRDDYLHFALLSDFCDADTEALPTDEALLALACRGIEQLNEKYQSGALPKNIDPEDIDEQKRSDCFFLVHRSRRWNPTESKWMGYERKRGKLGELNRALRGDGWDRFSTLTGNVAALSDVKYIITLDTDTELPRDSAQQFIATMAHPLNRPRYDERSRRVVGGYGILQPRMAASLSGANRSRYAQLCGNEPGIDPYTRSVSDVYQDLFAEGSFIGKGIYDVDAFDYALDDRLPEDRILSHDLLEGCYARSGLLSDVHLYEEYPARYQTDIARQQRWIRGDWQIASWLLPKVPAADGHAERNPLSSLSQWKVLDNLRRSLIPIAFTLLLLVGWFFFSQPWRWTLVVVAVLLIPPLLAGVVDALRRPQEVLYGRHLLTVLRSVRQNLTLILFRFACLPYEAWINLSAILRTSWRVGAHKRLLEWNVFNKYRWLGGDNGDKGGVVAAYRAMWIAPAVAVSVAMASAFIPLSLLVVVIPVTGLWLLAPVFSWWLSKPLARNEHGLNDQQLLFLRRIARKTWAFFDYFVTAEDHWLPPDNFQEYPGPVIAHRTSPTNIGMSLLANVSAADFGYISTGALLTRCTDTFATLDQLERHQGHFYNWYDTETLQPLPPRYISSVDSGNLAGHLLTLRGALLELTTQPMLSPRVFDGLTDSVSLMQEAVADARRAIDQKAPQAIPDQTPASREPTSPRRAQDPFDAALMAKLQSLVDEAVALQPITLSGAFRYLQEIAQSSANLVSASGRLEPTLPIRDNLSKGAADADIGETGSDGVSANTPGNEEVQSVDDEIAVAMQWLHGVARQAQDGLDDFLAMAPWITVKNLPAPMKTLMAFRGVPTLAELLECSPQWLVAIDQLIVIDKSCDNLSKETELSRETERDTLLRLRELIEQGRSRILDRAAGAKGLARQAAGFANMEYDQLYDRSRHLLAVGYNVDECRCDTSYYDLLASEARLCNFVAIAQNKLPQESWFALGRLLTKAGGEPVLVSWSGSMFEYLMPLLVMPMYDGSLLEQSCRAAVTRQIAYGKQRSMPWGVSESGYNIGLFNRICGSFLVQVSSPWCGTRLFSVHHSS